jgi:hypothetical protein
VVQKQAATGLEKVLVNEGENGHVKVKTLLRGDDGVLVIDNLLESTNDHRGVTHLLDLGSFLLLTLLLRLQEFLILDEFLLHEQVIFDSFLP